MTLAISGAISGCSDDAAGPEPDAAPSTSKVADVDPELVQESEGICATTRDEFAELGENVDIDTTVLDPLGQAVIKPGAAIYARQGEQFRELTDRVTPTPALRTYVSYFEVIDAILSARLRVGAAEGGSSEGANAFEARFQAVAAEHAVAATAAGVPGCGFDAFETIFGR